MNDMPTTRHEIESDAGQYRMLQAKRVIIACERLGYEDPRELSSEQAERVQREIAATRDAIDATVVERWPETFEGLD